MSIFSTNSITTSSIYLSASTVTQASLIIRSGTTYSGITLPPDGAITYDGNNAFMYINTGWQKLNNTSFKSLSDSPIISGSSVTATTQIMKSFLIPGNTFDTNDVINLKSVSIKSGTSGTMTVSFWVTSGSTLTLNGATQLGIFTNSAAQTYLGSFERTLYIQNKTGNTGVLIPSNLIITDIGQNLTTSRSLLPINWSLDRYLIVGQRNVNSTDSSFVTSFVVNKI